MKVIDPLLRSEASSLLDMYKTIRHESQVNDLKEDIDFETFRDSGN